MVTLVTGGSGSGKSAFAEQEIVRLGKRRRIYIATMKPWDEECRRRIERHRLMRADKQFETVECYLGLERLKLPAAGKDGESLINDTYPFSWRPIQTKAKWLLDYLVVCYGLYAKGCK